MTPEQGTLFPIVPFNELRESDPRSGTLTERAERFHLENPVVYDYAVRVARYLKAKGLPRYGIGAVWEIMRFKRLETHGDIYKLNNSYRAFYARLIMAHEPDLAGFFQVRESRIDAHSTQCAHRA